MNLYKKELAAAYDETFEAWSGSDIWPFLLQLVSDNTNEAHSWLDICCGTGRLLRAVKDHGFEVTGVDASPAMLSLAKQNVRSAVLQKDDMCSFRLGRKFDVISCLGGSLNYLTTKRDIERALRNARRHMSRDGGAQQFCIHRSAT